VLPRVSVLVLLGALGCASSVRGTGDLDAGADPVGPEADADPDPAGPRYASVPACDDPRLWELEPSRVLPSRDLGKRHLCGPLHTSLPIGQYVLERQDGTTSRCVRAETSHSGFRAGEVLSVGTEHLFINRRWDPDVVLNFEVRTHWDDGRLTSERVR